MRLAVLFFAFVTTVYCEPFIEAQDPSLEEHPQQTTEKRWHNYCSRRCYYNGHCPSGYYCDRYRRCCRPNNQRPCSHHSHCPQGWYCDGRVCKVLRYCYSGSNCANTQCCAKYHPQAKGLCRNLKKPGEWCPWQRPDGYHCGCVEGYVCKRYGWHRYWGKCEKKPCLSDSSCQKTHCCSGGRCKQRKKANEYCPLKGADIYHCGCIEGYNCKNANVGNYWGKCEQVVPPTEEPGSGLGE